MASGQLLEWDTDFWGVRIARADGPDVGGWARENRVVCAYLLVPAPDLASAHDAEERGFRVMDVRVELEAPAALGEAAVRPYREGDVDRLATVARSSHADTRFYADPRFPRGRCDDFYETWLRRSCEGWADAVLVAEAKGRPSGYVSLHRRGDHGSIGLIGVDADVRGRGLGEALVRGALAWCVREGLQRCTVVTQGRNVTAQRLFQRCGFRTLTVDLWFHKWFDE